MLQTIMQITEQYVMLIAAFCAALIVIIFLSRNKIKNYWLNFKIRRQLNRFGIKQLSNVQWPDGLDHYFNIDRLIMRHDGISLLMYKRFHGKIFCADNIDEWTQMIGQKSYTFANPLNELDYQINTLSEAIPGIPVNGFIYFDHLSEFPKGHPDRVIHYKKTPEELKRNKDDTVQENIASAWEKLLQMKKIM